LKIKLLHILIVPFDPNEVPIFNVPDDNPLHKFNVPVFKVLKAFIVSVARIESKALPWIKILSPNLNLPVPPIFIDPLPPILMVAVDVVNKLVPVAGTAGSIV
jgi:hypothetical protein